MIRKAWDRIVAGVAIGGLVLLGLRNTAWGDEWAPYLGLITRVALAVLVLDLAVRFLLAREKMAFLKQAWIELAVFPPVAAMLLGAQDHPASVILVQAALVIALVWRKRPASRPAAHLTARPAQALAGGFALVIALGTILLMLPCATVAGNRTPFLDALFTATSAICVTGLTVRDTAMHFSLFGQMTILVLIQLGGLGIMTATVSLVLILRRNLDVRQQVAMQDVLDNDTLAGARRLTLFIIGMTALLEIAGAAALTLAWRGRFASCGIAAYHAVFHAISAFCNAGFSTFSENLMGFRGDIVTNAVVCLLIVGGGLGFTVVKDLGENLRARAARGAARLTRLRVQTRIVLAVTAILIVAGALLLYVVEAGGAFKGWSERDKVLASVFQSVTARTAGYNTCDIGALSPASQFTLIVLMFIGASPGGTGGGIKTTTVVALWAIVFSLLLGRDHAQIHRRTVPVEIVLKAVTVLCISLALVLVFAGVLMYTEKADPLAVLFETVSAFGTVGLSMGITPSLTPAGKLLITLMMFIGRLGPLTMAYALAFRRRPAKYEYAEERMMIG